MKDQVISNFIYETTLISPIEKIIKQLENWEFRDCDIKWLNEKINKFTDFALETLGKRMLLGELDYTVMNEFVREKFTTYFTTLLNYFKSIK